MLNENDNICNWFELKNIGKHCYMKSCAGVVNSSQYFISNKSDPRNSCR